MSQFRKILISAVVAVAFTFAFTGSVGAVTADELQAQINALLAQLSSLQSQLATVQGTTSTGAISGVPAGFTFAKNLTMGSTGNDVKYLQIVLNSDPATQVAASGAGSSGKETTTFGALTKAAVVKFQEKYAASVLTPAGLSKGTGFVGSSTRAKLNALLGATSTTTPTTPTTTVTTGQFTASVASDTPAAAAVVTGQALAPLAKFSFANGTGSSVNVTHLALKRLGISADTTLSNVYLFDGATRLTDAASVTSGVITFNASNGVFSVGANSVRSVSVLADIATGTSGQTVGAGINAAADVTLSSGSVSGTFPVNGNLMSIASATLATIDFNTTTTPSTTSIDPQNDYTMWQNIVTVGTRAAYFSRISLRQIGSVRNADLQNFRLYVDGVQVGSAVQNLDSNGYVTFDLSASPVKLETGSRTIKLVGDIIGGSNLNFQFSLRNTADATFKDSQLNVAILATANSSTFSPRTTGAQSVNYGVVTITKRSDSPAGNVVLSANNITLAKYDVKAAGEPVKVENLVITVDSSRNTVGRLRNGVVYANGVQIGSPADLYELDSSTASTTYNFGSSLIVTPGSPVVLEVRADIYDNDGTNNLTAGDTLQVRINTGSSNGFAQVSNTTSNVPASNQSANSVTVQTGALVLSQYTGFAGPSYVVPQTKAKLSHFVISAGATEDVNLNTITFDYVTGTASNLTNLYAVLDTQTLPTKATISASGNTYNVNYVLKSGTGVELTFYGDISSAESAANAAIFANVTGTTTGSATTTYGAADGTSTGRVVGQTVTFTTGTFTENKDGSTPLNQLVAANQTVTAAAFKFSAQNDSYTINELRYKVGSSTAANAIKGVVLKDGTTSLATSAFTLTTTNTLDTVDFTNLSVQIPANTTKVLILNAVLADVSGTNSAASGVGIRFSAIYNKYISSTGTITTDSTVGSGSLSSSPASNTLYAFEGYPSVSAGTRASTNATNGTDELATWKIKANSASIAIKQLKFSVSFTDPGSNSTLKIDQFKLLRDGTDITGNVTITNEFGNSIEGTTTALSETSSPAVYITWDSGNEEAIGAGQEASFSLKGVTSGFTTDTNGRDGVTFSLTNATDSSTLARKYLAKTTTGTQAYALASSAGQTTGSAADLVWSDNSGGNASSATTIHNAAHNSTGTADWANGYLVNTLPVSQSTTSL